MDQHLLAQYSHAQALGKVLCRVSVCAKRAKPTAHPESKSILEEFVEGILKTEPFLNGHGQDFVRGRGENISHRDSLMTTLNP